MTAETDRQHGYQTLRSGGRLWGDRRVAARISLAQLAQASKVSKGLLSLMENGRLIPTGAEYEAITAALRRLMGEAA